MSAPVESQFEDYCAALATALGHADRHGPAKLYLKGLLLPGDGKSVEPIFSRAVRRTLARTSGACTTLFTSISCLAGTQAAQQPVGVPEVVRSVLSGRMSGSTHHFGSSRCR